MIRALGIDVFLKDADEGPPTLFLHGNPDSADLWDGDPLLHRLPLAPVGQDLAHTRRS